MNENYKFKILYVEDNNDISEEIIFFLQMFIENLIVASNGEEGLEKFKKTKPDIIITDIQMPKMNGIKMIEEIKKINSDIPIIITTAFNDIKYLSDAINLQVSKYLMKPINLKLLKSSIFEVYEPLRLKNCLIEKNKDYEELTKNLEENIEEKTNEIKKNMAFLKSYQLAMDESSLVSKTNKKGIITYVNENLCVTSGYKKEELLGKSHSILRHPTTPKELFIDLWKTIMSKKIWKGEFQNRGKTSDYWIDTTILPILDDNNEIAEFIAIRHDITQIVNQKEKLYKLANTDSLTGYFNRNKFLEDLNENNSALAIINIKKFRDFNDFYGFEFGDEIIIQLLDKVNTLIENSNLTLYRLHADEFAILGKDINNSVFTSLMESFLSNELTTLIIYKKKISIDIYISISFEKENLMKTAEIVKDTLKNSYKRLLIYNKNLNLEEKSKNYLMWTKKIKQAVENDNFVPFFQPIVDNKTLKWGKAESLVRLKEKNGNIVSPFFFLRVAKKSNYYFYITKIMVNKTFNYFENRDEEFSINLSIRDILDEYTLGFILSKIKSYSSPNRVIFEIEESEGIDRFDEVISFIDIVKSYGCKIAIDDFGTGYSNFAYLLKFKADFIKIDGSLIKDITENKNSKIIVKNIVNFAKDLNIKTVAEYVENEEIFNEVKSLGVDYSQGYYFSKPIEELK